jgi:hypothetical protein
MGQSIIVLHPVFDATEPEPSVANRQRAIRLGKRFFMGFQQRHAGSWISGGQPIP